MGNDLVAVLPLFGAMAGYLVLANVLTYHCFGLDKQRSVAGEWRLSERRLLLMALAGGWFGAKLAQRRFRHKTRKQPFGTLLNGVVLVQIAVVAVMLAPVGGFVDAAVQAGGRVLGQLVPAEQSTQMAAPIGLAKPAKELPRRFGPGADNSALHGSVTIRP